MSRTEPGRLYRKLPTVPRSIFSFNSTPATFFDAEISSVTITRGADQRGGGHTPSILEITVPGAVTAALNGATCRFSIRTAPANAIGAMVGKTGAQIMRRYHGRVGAMGVDDEGTRYSTTISASSYTQQMLMSPGLEPVVGGRTVKRVLEDHLGVHDGSQLSGIEFGAYGTYDRVARDEENRMTFSEVVSKYAAELGILIRQTRAGRTEAYTSEYRRDLATGIQLSNMPHLTRGQVLTPARWQQSNEQPGARVEYTITNENGVPVTRVAEIATNIGTVETVEKDWAHVYADTLQTYLEAYGLVWERSARIYRLESISIDLLHLITSDNPYDRQQAGNLLTLEEGDPIYLSGDWANALQGVHFAQQIKETITSDSWQLDLALYPIVQVLGTITPPVPARVWAAARYPWSDESRTWNL